MNAVGHTAEGIDSLRCRFPGAIHRMGNGAAVADRLDDVVDIVAPAVLDSIADGDLLFWRATLQVVVGGALVFAAGVLIGSG